MVRSARTQREEEPFPHRQATLSRWGQGSDGSMGSDACGMDSRAARTSFRLIPSPFFRVPPLIGRFDLHPWTISTAPAWPARCGTCGPRRRLAARGFFWMMHRFSYLEPLSLLFSCLSVLRGLVCDGQASLLLEFDASLLVLRQPAPMSCFGDDTLTSFVVRNELDGIRSGVPCLVHDCEEDRPRVLGHSLPQTTQVKSHTQQCGLESSSQSPGGVQQVTPAPWYR